MQINDYKFKNILNLLIVIYQFIKKYFFIKIEDFYI